MTEVISESKSETVRRHRNLWFDVWLQFRSHTGALFGVWPETPALPPTEFGIGSSSATPSGTIPELGHPCSPRTSACGDRATTTVFSVFNGVLLKPLPFRDACSGSWGQSP